MEQSLTSKPVTDWGNTVYDGLSGVGEFKADLGLFIGLILGLVFTVVGIYLILTDDSNNYLNIQGKVVEPNCVRSSVTYDSSGHPIESYKCIVVVGYKIDGKVYSKRMYLNGSNNYIKDEPISLIVPKNDYNDVRIATIDNTSLGTIMICVALMVVGIAYINYYLTHRYRVFAASQGASTVFGLFR